MSEVIQFPGIPKRYPPHLSLVERLKDYRKTDQSKATVQEMTDAFRITIWRAERLGNAMRLCGDLVRHKDGGKEWVLQSLEELKKYVQEQD